MEEPHPPKPRMVIRVGVTGHRQKSLEEVGFSEPQLRSKIRQLLIQIQDTTKKILLESEEVYISQEPVLRVISPLAEGSDRLVADEARKLGHDIQCPIPLALDEYENDFETLESKSQFKELLDLASATLILDGSPEDRDSAYEAVGRVVLRQSDVLIAIWNGQKPGGKGGTGQIVKEALDKKIPTVWIRSTPPHSVTLLDNLTETGEAGATKSLNEECELHGMGRMKPGTIANLKRIFLAKQNSTPRKVELLEARLRSILAPPSSGKQSKMLRRFFLEVQPRFRDALLYKNFCKYFVPSWKVTPVDVEDFESSQRQDWLKTWKKLSNPNSLVGSQIEGSYRKAFVWADIIADMCADRHRSSFIVTYLLGALAVFAAFLGSHPKDLPILDPDFLERSRGFFLTELIFISIILLLVQLNKRLRWHERWIDYRLLAEGLRQMRALAPFARVTPSFEVPAHLSAPAFTWFNWYFRSIVREAGMIKAVVDKPYLDSCRTVLLSEISSQVRYHTKNARRHKALHHRLHKLSTFLFLLTLIACIAHLSFSPSEGVEFSLTLCAIVLPAFGAAIQGILHQGDFSRLENRSRGLRRSLFQLKTEVKPPGDNLSFGRLGEKTEIFSQIQILEQADWRSTFIIKDISLP